MRVLHYDVAVNAMREQSGAAVLFDIAKKAPSPAHSLLFAVLRRMGVPRRLLNTIHAFYTQLETHLGYAGCHVGDPASRLPAVCYFIRPRWYLAHSVSHALDSRRARGLSTARLQRRGYARCSLAMHFIMPGGSTTRCEPPATTSWAPWVTATGLCHGNSITCRLRCEFLPLANTVSFPRGCRPRRIIV